MTVQELRMKWLKFRIAYHRRQASASHKPVPRAIGRDYYRLWLHTEALRHAMKAEALERELVGG
jgi:hypothetical protein